MIVLMFEKRGQYFNITIENKKILYWDKCMGKLWGGPLQYLPPDPSALQKIEMSRNKIPQDFKEMIKVTKEDLADFENAKDEIELKELILKDTKRYGCKLIKEETK